MINVSGAATIRRRANAVIADMRGRSLKGLIKTQSSLHEQMLSIPPTIPKEYGNLRRSYFCATSNGAIRPGRSPIFTNERKAAGRLKSDHARVTKESAARAVSRKKTVGPNIVFGFSAYYAWWVHEMVDRDKTAKINWTTAGSGPKYFDTHIKRYRRKILKDVAAEMSLRRRRWTTPYVYI